MSLERVCGLFYWSFFSLEMSLWLLVASGRGLKRGLILVNKDLSMSSGFQRGRGFLATIEKGIWVLGRDCVSFREEC